MVEHQLTNVELLIRVDDVCQAFEAAFRRGGAPRVEDFVREFEESGRSTLLRELVALELELRLEKGESLASDDVLRRYASLLSTADEEAALRDTVERLLAEAAKPLAVDPDATDPFLPAADSSDQPAFPQVEGFAIQSVLGRGGMGIVYRAMQLFPRRPVALKMILDKRLSGDRESQEYFERFMTEAQAVADLNDPCFVQIYQFGESDGRPFMALEFVAGGSLEAYRHGEPQPIDFSTRVVEQLARGMEKAHRAGVVHRDLKPHNVLLTEQGLPKITDFGLAKRLNHDPQLTADGRALGTPSYMAPEQTYGTRDVGPAADTYALGGILYCLLTGRPPFQAATWRDTFEQVCHQEPVAPSRLNPKISRDLETICLKCLHKEPSRRYATAGDLADDLRRLQEGRPILARPVSRLERSWRWARRNPWVSGLSAAVGLLLVAVAVVSTVMTWELTARNRALVQEQNRTQQQRNASLDVVRNVLLGVDEMVRDQPSLGGLRTQLINQALLGLDTVREQGATALATGPRSALIERTEAIAHQRMAEMYLTGDRLEDAQQELKQAHEILERLFEIDSRDPVNVRNLAAVLNLRGNMARRTGNTPAALADYQRALELRLQWLQALPEHPEARRAVAQSHGLVGKILGMQGDSATALRHEQEAKKIYDALPTPENRVDARKFHQERAANEQAIGEWNYQLGKPSDAEQAYQAALALRESTAKEFREHPTLVRDVALSHISLGNFYLLEHKDPGRAWEQYSQALLDQILPLARAQPTNPVLRRDMASIHYRLGATFLLARKQELKALPNGQPPPDPRVHFEQSRKLREELAKDPQDVQAQLELAIAMARCGQAADAVERAQALAAKAAAIKDPYFSFQAACILALCAETADQELADRCRQQALTALEESKKHGWQDHIALANDPDLDPIRSDPRFQSLLASLKEHP